MLHHYLLQVANHLGRICPEKSINSIQANRNSGSSLKIRLETGQAWSMFSQECCKGCQACHFVWLSSGKDNIGNENRSWPVPRTAVQPPSCHWRNAKSTPQDVWHLVALQETYICRRNTMCLWNVGIIWDTLGWLHAQTWDSLTKRHTWLEGLLLAPAIH